jgi:16S rRNA (guanine1207-N2)-methyltransferase
MSASLLPEDSAAADSCRELLADFPQFREVPGLPQARMLVEYIIGRRRGELDVSGRDAAGTFIDAAALAEVPHRIIVIDDARGIQTALLGRLAEVVVHHDRIDESRAAAQVADAGELSTLAELSTGDGATAGETWAIINAPKTTNALAEIRCRPPAACVRDHRHRPQRRDEPRGEQGARARIRSCRCLARSRQTPDDHRQPTPVRTEPAESFPKRGVITHPSVGELEVRAHGACFSGVRSDEGSTLLLDALIETLPGSATAANPIAAGDDGTAADSAAVSKPESILDLGCGNGWLLTAAMRATGALRGTGVDVSKAAVASARATAEANGVDVDIVLGDAADHEDSDVAALGEFDLIVLNPPFHQGTTIETDTASALMAAAAGHLAPGGQS